MRNSIRKEMLIGTISIVTGSMLLLALTFMLYSRSVLNNQFKNSANDQLVGVGNTIDMFLGSVKADVELLSIHPINTGIHDSMHSVLNGINPNHSADKAEQDLIDLYKGLELSHPEYVEVYIGTESGCFVSGKPAGLPAGFDPRKRPWYEAAMKNPDQVTISSVYSSASANGVPVITICKPVKVEGKIRGVIGIDVSLEEITSLMGTIRIGDHGLVALMQSEGTVIANPIDTSYNFKNVKTEENSLFSAVLKKEPGKYALVKSQGKRYLGYQSPSPLKNADWNMVGFIDAREISGPIANMVIIVTILFIAITIALTFIIKSYLTKTLIIPFTKVTEFVKSVSDGDFSIAIVNDREDEIGDIQVALQHMTSSLQVKTELAQKIADGDLTDRGIPSSKVDTLGIALENMVTSLNGIMNEMSEMAVQVSTGSQQLAQASNSLSDGATQQAAAVEQISSSVNEIETEVKKNAARAVTANTLAGESRKTAETGSAQMSEMVVAMDEISTASREISRIMKVIDDIAFQTNLLALNAAVEAARAGQHGKGFAVVADEVRNLAQRSAKASADTADLITRALDKISVGSTIATETSKSFGNIVDKIGESADLIAEIARSATSEAGALGEIAVGLDQISIVTQQNTAGSEETAATSGELSHHADQLQLAIARFKLQDQPTETRSSARIEPKSTHRATRISLPAESNSGKTPLSYGDY